ncbi:MULTISPECIES: hypothetical protein [unclassified Bacillus (in: firmicutes)]|nr:MULTISPECIES: hypothetical protein [unclassified Bacillus (in: firmicutes)]MBT2640212.1 hypothetical protein [Bacillus sp. ISL-39]MBT2662426.1 hypothetical protein [Bacillus sp. ISL-45]
MNQVMMTEDASKIIWEMIEAFVEELPNMKFKSRGDWVALMNYKKGVMRF